MLMNVGSIMVDVNMNASTTGAVPDVNVDLA